jgi:hypothetical protein
MLAFAVSSALAQTLSTANVFGTVTDPSGGVVPGASVTVIDNSTNEARTTQTNKAGHYEIIALRVGTYTITVKAKGFREFEITNAKLEVGKDFTFDAVLEVGAATQVVEVRASVGAELQTLNSTMGTSLSGNTILNLPTTDRDITSLLYYSPTAAPTYHGDPGGNETGGQIGGAMSDENTFMLDGASNTSVLEGDNGYVNGNHGVVPTPSESIDEFKVNTNNMTADFTQSTGAQVLAVTKRGTNAFHGAAYDYYQSSAMDSNDWYNNFVGDPKPSFLFNRFGGALGGPLLPSMLGGKTYFFINYEGQRYPRSGPTETTVPSDALRAGIVTIPDANGNPVQYNLKTSTQCGPTGGLPCDPRGIGINPVVSALWSKYEPEPNDFSGGDHLGNTYGYRANLVYPLRDDIGTVRLDHDFGSRNRFFTTWRYYREMNPVGNQTDFGGLLPGDTKGDPAATSSNPLQPRLFTAGLTTTVSPTLTNDFRFGYKRDYWQWDRPGAVPQISGIPAAMEFGESSALIPMDNETQNARARLWDAHDWDYRDTLSWLKGTHFFQFGGEFHHIWMHFIRFDNVIGGLTSLVYDVSNSDDMQFDPTVLPQPCSSTLSAGCLPSSYIGTWKGYYPELLGMVGDASVVATRSGANLSLNPLGTPLSSHDIDDNYSIYFSDAWKIKPNLTLSYGLNWSVQMPPYATDGEQDIETDAQGQILTPASYYNNRLAAAQMGQVYNPIVGFTPIGAVGAGIKYPYEPYYGSFGPRVGLAWSPNYDGGILGKLFGHKSTVIRGGYARFYDRINAIDQIAGPTLGDGFLQPVSCYGPSITGQCQGVGVANPTNAFRIGVDGNVAPFPNIAQTETPPIEPGINAPFAVLAESLGYNFRPGSSDQIDFSVQRQMKGDMILEVGYIGRWAKHLYIGTDLNSAPWMTTAGGQTFAQAYANLWSAATGKTLPGISTPVSPTAKQPFFETALAGSSYCGGFPNCTAAVASYEGGNIVSNAVTNIWSDLDPYWTAFGPAMLSTNQTDYAIVDRTDGVANYQALVVSLQKRASHGLTFNANLTYGKSLGTQAINQEYTFADLTNPWNPKTDYGSQFWDRKGVVNLLGTYELPFSKGRRWASSNPFLSRIISGWSLSPIFTFGTGYPIPVYTGSCQEFGQGFAGVCDGAIPMMNTKTLSNSPHFGITQTGLIGSNGNAANGGAGVNLYGTNAAAVYNSFRPIFPGIDGRSDTVGSLRGLSRYNLDLGITKDTRITERVGVQFFMQMFNFTNHMEFGDACWGSPCLNLQDPADFGQLNSQFNVQGGNYTRTMQVGLRVSF